ncbi:hypothetical protein PGT21_028612 [Puccinia graminis f. sp. tritici]|uniref:Uncharacterized protein n=1 Tax=Puccinia graminis f. sp. tritici TaxID=56615 RepID=A0A5B0NDB1_PUCGR|nr:hypothetical protein PGT21_028612 [Puccinia graminis f. sp. tritici]
MPENDKKCPKCLAEDTNEKPRSGRAPKYGRGLPTDSGPYGFPNPPPDRGGSLSPPSSVYSATTTNGKNVSTPWTTTNTINAIWVNESSGNGIPNFSNEPRFSIWTS